MPISIIKHHIASPAKEWEKIAARDQYSKTMHDELEFLEVRLEGDHILQECEEIVGLWYLGRVFLGIKI